MTRQALRQALFPERQIEDPEALLAFVEHSRLLNRRALAVTGGALAVIVLVTWPTDFIALDQGSPEFPWMQQWRTLLFLDCAAAWLAMRGPAVLRRRALGLALLFFGLGNAFSGHLTTLAGGLSSPFFYGVFPTPLMTVLLVCDLPRRLAGTLMLIVVYFAAAFVTDPGLLTHPLIAAPVLWSIGAALCAVVVGHVTYHLLFTNFLQRRDLDRRTRELGDLTRTLEERVAAQTREIRTLADNLARVQEGERIRVAREIHDETGQVLTGLRMELDRARRILGETAPENRRAAAAVEQAETLLDAVHGSVDRLINALRPAILETQGLVSALDWLGRQLTERNGIPCTLEVEVDEESLSPEVSIALYRIVQEALTNVARHSGARNAEVRLEREAGGLVLTVRDDGRGFAAGTAGEGFGLMGIRERSRLVGGGCGITSSPGAGTEIRVTLEGA